MAIVLPTSKSTIDKRFINQKFGMIGPSGIGKSEFWAQDENALFIEAEPGLNFLSVFKLPMRDYNDLREIYGALLEAVAKKQFNYSVIVLDTIDRVISCLNEEVVDKARGFYKNIEINTIGDIPNGMGWFKAKELMLTTLKSFEQFPCAIAYIGHLSTKRVKDNTAEYDKNTISIGGQMGEELLAWTDHTLHVDAVMRGDKLVRTIWTKPRQSKEAKSRGGVVPDGTLWGSDMKKNYNEFRALFE